MYSYVSGFCSGIIFTTIMVYLIIEVHWLAGLLFGLTVSYIFKSELIRTYIMILFIMGCIVKLVL